MICHGALLRLYIYLFLWLRIHYNISYCLYRPHKFYMVAPQTHHEIELVWAAVWEGCLDAAVYGVRRVGKLAAATVC